MPDQLTYQELLRMAGRHEHEWLETPTGRRFHVGIYLDCPFFIPESSGRGRSDGPKAARTFIERFNETGSHRPADYQGVTRNASYFIGLIEADERVSRRATSTASG
jgi:hypothetical protein